MRTRYVLRLYVAGKTPRSEEAIAQIRRFCEEDLKEECELRVIDTLDRPDLAAKDDVLVTPVLVKVSPPPVRRLVGDFSDRRVLLESLGIVRREGPREKASDG